jgi:protein gp37
MGENTKISWCNMTFNAWIGCTKVSPGCKFCYAEELSHKYDWAKWGNNPRYRTSETTWNKMLSWQRKAEKDKTRYRVFVSSLSDIMEDNPQLTEWREEVFELCDKTPSLDKLFLTKRAENYTRFIPDRWKNKFPHHIWLGTTICNQQEYDEKWPLLKNFQQTFNVPVTFVSFEPLLGNIVLNNGAPDWSIIGGESGFLKNAREMDLAWVKNIISQVKAMTDKKHHLFFKQFGSHLAKKLNMTDKKGEAGIDMLPPAYDWLKIREIPGVDLNPESHKKATQKTLFE